MSWFRSACGSVSDFFYWLGTPFRTLVNLTGVQMRALFSIAMIGGMISLSVQNIWVTLQAREAVDDGDKYRPFFELLLFQLKFNSGLIAWFALIMGLLVFGADYFRARKGDTEVDFGRRERPPE